MREKKILTIGTRKSDLAVWQANHVKREIEKKNKDVSIKMKYIVTAGDKVKDIALSKIGDKGLFTKELEMALLNGEIDMAVNSCKDMQTTLPRGLRLSAVTVRHHAEDVLIGRKKGMTLEKLPDNAVVATGSLRRKSLLLHMRPDIKIVELRGNVNSRIKKFENSDWDAIILARAGVERLKMGKYISSVIPKEVMIPAVGQGALGIETASKNKFAGEIVKLINHENTYSSILAERAFLKTLQGGCQAPIGAYAEVGSNGLYLDGVVGSLDGAITFRRRIKGKKSEAEKLGKQLAMDLKKAGADVILKEIYSEKRN